MSMETDIETIKTEIALLRLRIAEAEETANQALAVASRAQMRSDAAERDIEKLNDRIERLTAVATVAIIG